MNPTTFLLIQTLSLYHLIVHAKLWYKAMISIIAFCHIIMFQEFLECIVIEAIKPLLVS